MKTFATLVEATDETPEGNWLLDSEVTNHMTPDLESLSEIHEYSGVNNITIGFSQKKILILVMD